MTWSAGIVSKEHVAGLWPVVAPLLKPAVDRSGGRISMDTVFASLEQGTHLLWIVADESTITAAFTTRVAQYPLKRMLVVECLGGSRLREWVSDTNDTLIRFAKDSNLDGIEMYGRNGWSKALAPYGWKTSMVLCEVNFDQETTDV